MPLEKLSPSVKKSEMPQSSKKEKQTKSGKLKKLAKKAGLVLGLGTAIGLSAATLEGLKNDPQNNIETSAETKKKDPGETVEQMSKDLQDLEGLDRKIKDQAKIDELRRFIARESKSGDELYSVGKDPFAVPGEPEDLAPQRELSETEIYKKEMAMNEEDLDHLSDFFDRVLKQSNNKYRFKV